MYRLVSRFSVNASIRSSLAPEFENSLLRDTWSISSAVSNVDIFIECLLCFQDSGLVGWETTKPISASGSDRENSLGQFESVFEAGGSHRSFSVETGITGICFGAPRSAMEKVECMELAADHG